MKQIHISSKNLLHHMRNIGVLRMIKIIPVFLIPVFIFSACMKDDYEEVEEELCPDIVSTNPVDNESNFDITSDITVTFNKEMCIDAVRQSFFVYMGSDTISGEIYTNDDKTFGFRPEFNLNAKSSYEAIVTTDVADCYGLTLLGGDYKWTFATRNEAPQVISTLPVNDAVNVPRNTGILIEFDRAINPNTLSMDMFALEDVNGNEVNIFNWEYSERVIKLHADNLKPNLLYNATLKSGVEDLLGYFMEEDYNWSFTSGVEFQIIPRSVNLRSVYRFAVFSSDFISNSGASSITGDVGIIPGLITDISGIDESDVIGEIIADLPEPIGVINPLLNQAKNDLSAAYLFAEKANIPDPEPLSGDQLTPGIYFIDASYDITGDLVLDGEGDPDAFWIFQIDGALEAANGIEIVLTNGAHPNNVYWQVGDNAIIGENASFIGNIMAKDGIELLSGASITGRLLVKNGGITLNNNIIVIP